MAYPAYIRGYPLPSWKWHRPTSYKTHIEQSWILKRDLEIVRKEYWQGVSQYFSRTNATSRKHITWESSGNDSNAFKTWKNEQEQKNGKTLEERREELRKLLYKEKRQYEAELRAKHRDRSQPDILSRIQELKQKREQRNRADAKSRLEQQWRINQPLLRQQESKEYGKYVSKAWEIQIQEKMNEERRKKEEEEEFERLLETERKKMEENEIKEEAERKQRIEEWKNRLGEQVEELRSREKECKMLEQQELEYMQQRDELEHTEQQRRILQERKKREQMSSFWSRQHRLKLLRKAKEVQDSLEEDRKILQEVLQIEAASKENMEKKKLEAKEQMETVQRVLKQQLELERKREKEFHFLFHEEAEHMWRRLEDQWKREASAREYLMSDVITGLRQQIQERLEINKQEQNRMLAEREELVQSLKRLQTQIQAEQQQRQEERRRELQIQIEESAKRKLEEVKKERETELKIEEYDQDEERRLGEEIRKLEIKQFLPKNYGYKRRLLW